LIRYMHLNGEIAGRPVILEALRHSAAILIRDCYEMSRAVGEDSTRPAGG